MYYTYTLNFFNDSDSAGGFCIFNRGAGDMSLAWLVRSANPYTMIPISWESAVYFFWAKTGKLKPGITFNAGEALVTGTKENNKVTLTKQGGSYKFINQTASDFNNYLTVEADEAIVFNEVSVGIGMSGSCMYASQIPPKESISFSLPSKYMVTFGDIEQGEVMKNSEMFDPLMIEFPQGVFSLNVTLNNDKTWTISQVLD